MVGGLNRRNAEFLQSIAAGCNASGRSLYEVLKAHSHTMMPEQQFDERSLWDVTLSYFWVDRRPKTPPTLEEFERNYH